MCARTPFSMLPYGSVTPHFPTLVEKRLRISFVQIILPAHTKKQATRGFLSFIAQFR